MSPPDALGAELPAEMVGPTAENGLPLPPTSTEHFDSRPALTRSLALQALSEQQATQDTVSYAEPGHSGVNGTATELAHASVTLHT